MWNWELACGSGCALRKEPRVHLRPGVTLKRNEIPRTSCPCGLQDEYDVTVRVLAVLVERLQHLTGSSEVQIADSAVADQPDLTAWRNDLASISLTAAR